MHFVFVPGPADPYDVSNLILPRRPLPPSLIKAVNEKLPKVTFASNPCRITYKSQEIVVFRDDLMSRMLRNTVRLKNDLSALANRELLERMQSETGEQTVGISGRMEQWTDDEKGEARLKVLSQFVGVLRCASRARPLTCFRCMLQACPDGLGSIPSGTIITSSAASPLGI